MAFVHPVLRLTQIAFTQIRVGFSNLKHDLYLKGCIDNPTCNCGEGKEDASHFLLKCRLFTTKRDEMKANITRVCGQIKLNEHVLLYGSNDLCERKNLEMLHFVCQYIESSKRFS